MGRVPGTRPRSARRCDGGTGAGRSAQRLFARRDRADALHLSFDRAMTTPPPITGLLETALYVDDLARSTAFFEDIVGLKAMFRSERLIAYDAGPQAVLLVFARGGSTRAEGRRGGKGGVRKCRSRWW